MTHNLIVLWIAFRWFCQFLFFLFLFHALAGCRTWSTRDNTMAASVVACNAVDYVQTVNGLRHGYNESNPLLGSHPSDGALAMAKITDLGLGYLLAKSFPKYRSWVIGAYLAPCSFTTLHNYVETH